VSCGLAGLPVLLDDEMSFDDCRKRVTLLAVYETQCEMSTSRASVFALSAFPEFLLDYFMRDFWNKVAERVVAFQEHVYVKLRHHLSARPGPENARAPHVVSPQERQDHLAELQHRANLLAALCSMARSFLGSPRSNPSRAIILPDAPREVAFFSNGCGVSFADMTEDTLVQRGDLYAIVCKKQFGCVQFAFFFC
jgi:hypothetical protein